MSIFIGKDCWNIIAKYGLSTKDLLSLRSTCKYLNNIVKSMNEEWFRAHQWFLISMSNKSKAKSAVKVHRHELNYNCIDDTHPKVQEFLQKNNYTRNYYSYELFHRKVNFKKKIITEGEVTLDDCKNRYHWNQVVPKSRNDIPHTGYNKHNIYIYYYLIECYRYYNKKHLTELKNTQQEIDELKPQVDRYEYLLGKIDELHEKYYDNEIFKDCRVNSYKGV